MRSLVTPMIQSCGVSHGESAISFIKPPLSDDELHIRINRAASKLPHHRAGVSATFMTEVCASPELTVFPTVSSTDTKPHSTGKPS